MSDFTPTTEDVVDGVGYTWIDWWNICNSEEEAKAAIDRFVASIKAEAWEEGLDAGRDRWMDAREFGEKPVNPYREQP